jgi:hypothetical protein
LWSGEFKLAFFCDVANPLDSSRVSPS